MLIIESDAKKRMIDDAVHAFPDECCGFLFGQETADGTRIIQDLVVVNNAKEGDKTRRFEISPLDYMKAEQYAVDHSQLLLGVYHSHPNHPPIPSEHDRKAAQPWFSYIILSVLDRRFDRLRSWVLNEKEQFEEEQVNDHQLI